mmetsp:Transcript_1488/g.5851  ORF Transcript_1488/g.5851 Transcript_1488/m.5851 type:complete len:272 (-) Transcript_1488:1231-2046(-)
MSLVGAVGSDPSPLEGATGVAGRPIARRISCASRVSFSSSSSASLCRSPRCSVMSAVARAYALVSSWRTSLSTMRSVSALILRPAFMYIGPTASLMPYSVTMRLAMAVACSRSPRAPLVTASLPKTSSSAMRPPMQMSSSANICCLDCDVSSLCSGSCMVMPSEVPRGMMVALWMGIAPSVRSATSAWPASWNAVRRRPSSVRLIDLRSAPMRILSFANSSMPSETSLASSTAALIAAMLTKLYKSAPEKPGVPRASCSTSTSAATGLPLR